MTRSSARVARLGLVALTLGACVGAEGSRPSPHLVAPATSTLAVAARSAAPQGLATPEASTWRETALDLHVAGKAPVMPLTEGQITKLEGAESRWARLPTAARDGLRARGFSVVPAAAALTAPTRFGVFYKQLADDRVPFFLTLDALTGLAHAALSRALAEAEDRELAPALGTLLGRLDARLTAEERGARSDMVAAYAIAHGVVAVARALADASYALPPNLAPLVEAERRRVVAHTGSGVSIILGVTLDYASLAPRGGLEENDARAGLYRALAWLAHAPFLMLARSEARDARITVADARAHTRAALLLARLFDADVDKEVAKAWATVARVDEFVGGLPDDLTPVKLAELARGAGLDPKNAALIENVVLVDKVRRAAAAAHATHVYDGAGGVVASSADADASSPYGFPAAALSMRLVGARWAPDAVVLQALVSPRVRRRALPSSLDVASWLGSAEAREASRVAGDEGFEGYAAVRDELSARRASVKTTSDPEGAARHGSLYSSGLDVVATFLTSSAADVAQPYASTGAWRNRKVEVALALWTVLRHDSVAFARRSLGQDDAPTVRPSTARGFVEAHPEAIGKLLALVRQTATGLARLASVPKDAPGQKVLAEVDLLLSGCLRVALREANDEPMGADDDALLSSLPARIDALDARLARSGEAYAPLVIDVHADVEGARVLEEATGALDDLYVVLREPGTGRLLLAVGASSPHYELTQPAALRLTDEAWRARLRAGSAPPRHAFTRQYVVEVRPAL